MGYRTRYALRTVNPADDAHIRASITKLYHTSPFCADTRWGGDGECKWYETGEHCAKVSADNPDIMFIVYGCGEHEGDAWARCYKGGEHVEVNPTWDELADMMDDECELRESRK